MNTIDNLADPEPGARDSEPRTLATSQGRAAGGIAHQERIEPTFSMPGEPPTANFENSAHRQNGSRILDSSVDRGGTTFAQAKGSADANVALDIAFDSESSRAESDPRGQERRNWQDMAGVVSDIKRSVATYREKASNLGNGYRPNEHEKSASVDGDDDRFGQSAVSMSPSGRVVQPPQRPDESDRLITGRDDSEEATAAVPKSLAKRYLIAENKFYFRDDPNLLAFEDRGRRLATEHNDPMVARSMVELAHAKNWDSIKVKGTDEFRREVWLSASFRGIDVQGYEPRDVDVARLAELRGELKPKKENSIEQGLSREKSKLQSLDLSSLPTAAPLQASNREDGQDTYRNLTKQQRVAVDTLRAILTARGDSAKAIEMATGLASERFQQQRVYVGQLLAHGRAPYENKADEKMNYFVTLKTINGERTIWGVDLERGVAAGGIQTGDDLALVYRGRKRVKVLANERDDAGKLTGNQVNTEVNRNTWEVGKLDKLRDEVRTRAHAAAERSDRNQPVVPVYDVPAQRKMNGGEKGKSRSPDQPLNR